VKKGKHIPGKHVPDRWIRDYQSVTVLHKLPDDPLRALKTAIEEIGALEFERDRLAEDTNLLKLSLKDLQECRKNSKKLWHQRNGLQDALQKCQEHLVRTPSPEGNGKATNQQGQQMTRSSDAPASANLRQL
jgi:FtsZ-binding cell division protein ZapB